MAEASFKDVPELFEVRHRPSGVVLAFIPRFLGRNWGSVDRAHRKSRYVPSSRPRQTITTFLTATFRELGPPDLCHIVKSTGRAGQRDVSTHARGSRTTAHSHPARLLPLCLGGRRELLGLARRLHQLAHVRHRRQLGVVLQRAGVESEERVLLLLQCVLEGGRARGRQDSGRGANVCGRFAWGAVRPFLFFCGGLG
jgi:hypothetical protein